MNYIRIAAIGLGLVYHDEVGDGARMESGAERDEQIQETGEFHSRILKGLADMLQKNMEESNRLKHQQELEDGFWGNADELSDELNSIGLHAVVYEGTGTNGLSYAYVQFKLMNGVYWFALPDPENIKPEFKYNFVFFIDQKKTYVAANNMDEVMDQISARIDNSLLMPD